MGCRGFAEGSTVGHGWKLNHLNQFDPRGNGGKEQDAADQNKHMPDRVVERQPIQQVEGDARGVDQPSGDHQGDDCGR